MTAFTEGIRKIMGWCPNASMITNNKRILELQFGLKTLDKMALLGKMNYSRKAKVVIAITLVSSPILFWYSGHTFGREETLAFTSGFLFIIWIKFFEIVYWEKKNCKTLVLGKKDIYAVDNSK
ncbi:MAG: DUF1673 family protein [Candidatus Methanoperedens sp.]|nr:DUF1673 family protein [Candidatus Methanoperedens sp.]